MIRNDLPHSLIDNPELDRWIRFEGDGTVRLGTGKVELGQGVLTALRQIAAEELEIALGRIAVISGVTGVSPEEGFTAGSRSIEVSGGSIRIVCAEVRQLAMVEAAARLGCETDALTIDDGRFLRGENLTDLTYWTLAGSLELSRRVTGSAPFRPVESLHVVGRSVPRFDLPGILAGGSFIHDLKPDGLLHARILRRPHPAARLAALDEEAIRRKAGAAVEIVRINDFVAFAADDEATADRALDAARRAIIWAGAYVSSAGDADPRRLQAMPSVDKTVTVPAAADAPSEGRTVTATYTRPYIAHGSLGPSCALARWNDGMLTVWSHTQGVGPLRSSIARALELDLEAVEVRHHPGAGCYGHNGADDAAFDAALVAMRFPGRTARVRWTREDELSASPFGAASVVSLSATQAEDGRIGNWRVEIWSGPHGRRPGANGAINLLAEQAITQDREPEGCDDVPDAAGGGGNRNAICLYDLPGQRVLHHLVRLPPLRTSSLRGLGAHANVFAIESFVDELALAAGRCPVAYRLAMMSDPRARRVIEAVAGMAQWSERGAGGEGEGMGLAFSRYKNKAAYLAAVASVEVDTEVRVRRIWCAVDAGRVINPDGARNQIEGGAVQATSWTLKEQVKVDETGICTRTWETYPVLRFSEAPEIVAEFVGSPEEASLGVGEAALGPVSAAIANAVAHALGIRIRDLPLSRERLMAAMLQGELA